MSYSEKYKNRSASEIAKAILEATRKNDNESYEKLMSEMYGQDTIAPGDKSRAQLVTDFTNLLCALRKIASNIPINDQDKAALKKSLCLATQNLEDIREAGGSYHDESTVLNRVDDLMVTTFVEDMLRNPLVSSTEVDEARDRLVNSMKDENTKSARSLSQLASLIETEVIPSLKELALVLRISLDQSKGLG